MYTMKKHAQHSIEILYIAGSSRDQRGPRVLVRDDSGCENWIWSDDADCVTQIDMDLLGITEGQRGHIEAFFAGGRV